MKLSQYIKCVAMSMVIGIALPTLVSVQAVEKPSTLQTVEQTLQEEEKIPHNTYKSEKYKNDITDSRRFAITSLIVVSLIMLCAVPSFFLKNPLLGKSNSLMIIAITLLFGIPMILAPLLNQGNLQTRYESALLEESVISYVISNDDEYPVTKHYLGSGKEGRIYSIDQAKLTAFDSSITHIDTDRYGIETSTGKLYIFDLDLQLKNPF